MSECACRHEATEQPDAKAVVPPWVRETLQELQDKPSPTGEQLLTEELIDRRNAVYGDPEDIFPRVAQVWSGIIGYRVAAVDVALCMIGYKAVRSAICPTYSDNSDDIAGYLDIFRTLVGPDMVPARSVAEYLAKVGAGD